MIIQMLRSLQGCNHDFFLARKVSWNKGFSINISSRTHERKTPQSKISDFVLLGTLKTTFRMINLTHGWTQSGHFFRFS